MTFVHVNQPNFFERIIIILIQGIFRFFYFVLYICSPYTAHRLVVYLEEEAIISYSYYLKEIKEGRIQNIPAPSIAKHYWSLPKNAQLTEVIEVVLKDECRNREVNHHFANDLLKKPKS